MNTFQSYYGGLPIIGYTKAEIDALLSSSGVSLTLGETNTTAYRGDRGKIAYDHSFLTNNPHNVTKGQVGLGAVDNTSDINKPVSTAQAAAIAQAIADLIDSSPTTLNTLNELAAALGDDPNFATTIMTLLGQKAPLASPVFTGIPTAITANPGTNTTQLATTAFVQFAKRRTIRLVDSANSTTTTFAEGDDTILVDTSSADVLVNLIDANLFGSNGATKQMCVKKVSVGGSVNITPTGGQLIDGAVTVQLSSDTKGAIYFESFDGNWYITAKYSI